MTHIDVQNNTQRARIVPAREGFGVVLGPGERATVCPEGATGQGQFWNMVTEGVIAERGRRRSRVLRFIQYNPRGDYREAA